MRRQVMCASVITTIVSWTFLQLLQSGRLCFVFLFHCLNWMFSRHHELPSFWDPQLLSGANGIYDQPKFCNDFWLSSLNKWGLMWDQLLLILWLLRYPWIRMLEYVTVDRGIGRTAHCQPLPSRSAVAMATRDTVTWNQLRNKESFLLCSFLQTVCLWRTWVHECVSIKLHLFLLYCVFMFYQVLFHDCKLSH